MAVGASSEYKIVSGKPDAIEKQLNELAAQGWVVDHVTSASGGMGNFVLFGFSVVVTVILRRDRGRAEPAAPPDTGRISASGSS